MNCRVTKSFKIIGGILAIFLIISFLPFLSTYLKGGRTVDFGGIVEDISVIEDDRREIVISNFSGVNEHVVEITTDKWTVFFSVSSGKKLTVDDIDIGDYIDGNYRIFNKGTAKWIRVAQINR